MEQKAVLIVEDDGILAVHLRNMLVGLGCNVPEPVATGEAAISAVTAERPDLILMDIQLAGEMDGITAAGHIRSTVDVPVVFLTGYCQHSVLQQAKTALPYGYLIKPVSQRELAATIEIALYRHTLDRQIKEHEEGLSAIYESAPLIMLLLDGERRVCKVNKTATELADQSTAAMIGLHAGEALHCLHALDDPRGCGFGPHCQECSVRRTVMNTLTTGQSHHQVEAALPFSVQGQEKDLIFLLSTTRLNIRQQPMALLTLQDITQRKQAEAELLRSEQRVRRLNEQILNMVMILSHDIRGPLVAIASILKLLLRGVYGKLDQSPANTVQDLLSRCARLLGTAEDYLGKASSVAGPMNMEREVLDLRQDIIDDVLDELADDITRHEIVIDSRLGAIPAGFIAVNANKTWLKAVYRNLFSNAIKYGGKGCTISFGVEQGESHYRLNVYNSGEPIAEQDREKIFSKFGRIGTLGGLTQEGVGLGLYLCREIILDHGGEIWCEARPDGSNFVFTISREDLTDGHT